MATGWSALDALNKSSKAAAEDKPKARFRTRDISIKKMYSNDKNFYSMRDIDRLAQDILVCGMIENLTITYAPCDQGEYRIIAGERRWRALMMLVKKGYAEFEIATCQIKTPEEEHEETVQLIMANAYRDKTVMDILEEEKRLKEALLYMRDNGLTLSGYRLNTGRLRDVIAQIMGTTQTKIAQVESINKRLIPEFSQELKEGRLTFSAAYELSGMQAEKQRDMLERHQENGLTWKEVKEAKAEAEEDAKKKRDAKQELQEGREPEEIDRNEEWQQAHPESIVSLCYSCKRYSECNVKTGTCRTCDQYINKAEAEKTDEQRYEEEQRKIDRKTREKMREMQQEEKMQSVSSDERLERILRISSKICKNIESDQIPYMIVKEEKIPYREKELLTLIAVQNGKETGARLHVRVTCVDNAETSSGITEGYAVVGVKNLSDAKGSAVSESDTSKRKEAE